MQERSSPGIASHQLFDALIKGVSNQASLDVLTADWHHPVIAGDPDALHVRFPANCGAVEYRVLPGRADGVCCFHLPTLQAARIIQVDSHV